MIYNLKSLKKSTIMKYDKSKCLGAANASHPSAKGHFFIKKILTFFINFLDCCQFHIHSSFFSHSSIHKAERSHTFVPLYSIDYSQPSRKKELPSECIRLHKVLCHIIRIDSAISGQIKHLADIYSPDCFSILILICEIS